MEYIFLAAGILLGAFVSFLIAGAGKRAKIAGLKSEYLEKEKSIAEGINALEKDKSVLEERLANSNRDLDRMLDELRFINKEREELNNALSVSNTEKKNLEEKLNSQKEELESLHERFKTEFENLANKILKSNSEEFTSANKKNIDEILNPLKERIQTFEKKVEEAYDKELRDKISLKEEVKKLYELNSKISTEAQNLTLALKGDVKKQGNWGEVILERILERSGLSRGREYEREVVSENSEGKQIRPDVIIHLPEEKHIIIDSKVSLIAYERYVNASSEEERDASVKEHLTSMKAHIKGLAEKHYQSSKAFNTPDFVLMFVPIESSFALAVKQDQEVFNFAWENKIVIVSPSTLLATLKTIASIWKQEYQNRNVMEIARQGGALYDQFVSFCTDMQKLGKKLEEANTTYGNTYKKLAEGRGNLVRRAEKMRELGAKAKKQLPEELTAGIE